MIRVSTGAYPYRMAETMIKANKFLAAYMPDLDFL
jgi:hypothetical protein